MAFDTGITLTVEHGSPAVALTGVQSMTIQYGRPNFSDNYRSATVTIQGRDPDSLPVMKVGDAITIGFASDDGGVPSQSFNLVYRLANLSIQYGQVTNQDTWTMTCEDAFAYLGRATVDVTITAGLTTAEAIEDVCDAVGITFGQFGSTTTTVGAATHTNANALDLVQTYANTEWAWLVAEGDALRFYSRNGWVNSAQTYVFADDGTGDLTYQTLDFSGLADTFANKVVVFVRGGSQYESGTGNLSFNLDAYSQTAADAQSLAEYVKAVFGSDEPQPFTLSYLFNGQDPSFVLGPINPSYPARIELTFRTVTYEAFITGFSVSFTPGRYSATLYVMPSQSAQFLILDDPVFGKLDENRLGW
jgi:hypothetical protein